MTLALHLKYRPKNFSEVFGNKSTITSLKSVLERKEGVPHSFLFIGPSGCGKTTIARIVKNELGCSDLDFQEMNAADVRGIDAMRSIIQNCSYSPHEGKVKIYLLDEVHKATNDAQNALLKILEDTPSWVYFILCTTDPEKLIKTIKTRCTTYQVQALPDRDMKELINWVLKNEKINNFPEKAIEEICRTACGSPRQALVVLDSVIDIQDDDELIRAIVEYSFDEKNVADLCRALLEKQKWTVIAKILKNMTEEPEEIRYAVLGWMTKVLLDTEDPVAAVVIEQFSQSFMYSKKAGLVYAAYMVFH